MLLEGTTTTNKRFKRFSNCSLLPLWLSC